MRLVAAGLMLLLAFNVCAKRYYSEQFSEQDLGKAFNTQLYQAQTQCLAGDVKYHTESAGQLDYLQHLNETQIRRRTFGEIHGGINLFIVAGSVSTSITHKNATDNLSLTSQLHLKLSQGHSTLENRQIVNEGTQCGDNFIYQVNFGRDLFINTRLHFRSEADYKKFITKIKIRLLFFTKTKTKIKEIEKLAQNAVLTIDANSNGTLPPKLQQLLDSNPQHCRGSNISPCLNTLQALADYTFGGELSNELSTLPKLPRSIVTKSYEESGHFDVNVDENIMNVEQYEQVWRDIDQRFGQALRRYQRADAFLQVATEQEQANAEAELDVAHVKLSQLEDLRATCFVQPWLGQCH
ncbi:hypothetical protein PSECIP111951_03853 [Pseudoalteromonas holothuriae]|uniref:Uncharacterized protein n=1 Tax=Pseudoalteromonas holothuriae TaxID=2963714 RepID=A0A9W4R4C7_9GAMM|nr:MULTISPECIES: hypothetical protein [unclassified Pseudoalteromonas]CAH9066636.1 hypothetical protein PSECIP111854_03929 [Pseudoalteromonas sp. CIP111854]CAH9067644.1 hypothetical protein PSECIP111951_03853 [Pseudoalteromonas sp. CIP111951]